MIVPLTFAKLRDANLRRCEKGFGHPLDSWSAAEWGNATQGEAGEAVEILLALMAVRHLGLAGNLAKKMLRFRDGVAGNTQTREHYRRQLGKEIAGAVIYMDLWSASEGIDLAEAILDEFNSKSEEIGYEGKL